jgi:dUTP pyrophosphatase
MRVRIKKLHPDAIVPQYQTSGAACFDLHALILSAGGVALWPDSQLVVRTGLAFEIPEGHVMLVYSRSGHGFKTNVRLANCVGVIDSDYRGEVLVKLTNDTSPIDENSVMFKVSHGDRIAQAMIVPVPRIELQLVDDLSDTERGTNGGGSTGA